MLIATMVLSVIAGALFVLSMIQQLDSRLASLGGVALSIAVFLLVYGK
jgi:hypothetical protein